jgi:hypothetical protein
MNGAMTWPPGYEDYEPRAGRVFVWLAKPLAGLANRLGAKGGKLQIAEPGERNRHSLEDLGLDFLMEIEPEDAEWRGRIGELRGQLRNPREVPKPGQTQRAHHVLEAHQELSATNDENARKFANVVTLLEAELAEKQEKR